MALKQSVLSPISPAGWYVNYTIPPFPSPLQEKIEQEEQLTASNKSAVFDIIVESLKALNV